jgi:hypothetical protein
VLSPEERRHVVIETARMKTGACDVYCCCCGGGGGGGGGEADGTQTHCHGWRTPSP